MIIFKPKSLIQSKLLLVIRWRYINQKSLSTKAVSNNADIFKQVLHHAKFYKPAFSIYGGVQGLTDLGDVGCAVEQNIVSAWRHYFLEHDHIKEVKCSIITPEVVLKASGHLERFTDYVIKDIVTGECFRADHLISAHLRKLLKTCTDSKLIQQTVKTLDELSKLNENGLNACIQQYKILSPQGNPLAHLQPYNLMFPVNVGNSGNIRAFLRPETAQGIFTNFPDYQFQNTLPFGIAQVGTAFRNELAPESGLIRLREFCMAEIEYFCHPQHKTKHAKFHNVANITIPILTAKAQLQSNNLMTDITIGEAVRLGQIANETLGYFLGRIFIFLQLIGIRQCDLRFRQHLPDEMAHYCSDCWDVEIRMKDSGWLECIGLADRGAYDLSKHGEMSGTKLHCVVPLNDGETRQVSVIEVKPIKNEVEKLIKGGLAMQVCSALRKLQGEKAIQFEKEINLLGKCKLTVNDKDVEISKAMVEFKKVNKVVHSEEVIPHVIEPSFGIGRLMECILNHNFRVRELTTNDTQDEHRYYFALPAMIAPYQCAILPMSRNPQFLNIVTSISESLYNAHIRHDMDISGSSIGRRYARMDEIGVPYIITVDYDSVNISSSTSVTIRERDSMQQIRVPSDDVPTVIRDLCSGKSTWSEIRDKLPIFTHQQTYVAKHTK